MLDEILNDKVEIIHAQNEPLFDISIDYEKIKKQHESSIAKWKGLTEEEKKGRKLEHYLREEKDDDPKDPKFGPAKNYSLLKNEIQARVNNPNNQELLPIDALYFEQSSLELIENIENLDHIREIYRLRKRTVGVGRGAGLKAEEAGKIKNCLRQGRELYVAGKNASLMVKPLNFFYSMTACSYAIVLLNNPIRYSLDNLPSSHGMNYTPEGIKVQFGGDNPRGTFSELFTSFPTILTKNRNFELLQDNLESVLEFYRRRTTVTLGTLLSMVPEIREYYYLMTKNRSRTHPLEMAMGNTARQVQWEFHIGDGENRPNPDDISQAFKGFRTIERHGKVIVEVPLAQLHTVKACIFTDVRGKFWYIENPFSPVVLPEVCIHFLLMNAFSNLMRYSPDNWGNMLLNEVSSGVSLMTRKYVSAFENKYPTIILRSISKFYPHVA